MTEQPKRKLRILWQSNHPDASSGYSNQTKDIIRMFLKSGWDGSNFGLINMFGQVGYINNDANGLRNYPLMDHSAGSDAMLHHSRHFNADIVIALQDIWILNPYDLQQVKGFVPWIPVDYDPIPKALLQNCRFANRIIAMSKFGQKQLADNGFASTYIPHHVDTSIFYPMDKKKRKMDVKIDPNNFIFGMVSANKDILPRKSFGHVLEAFKRFHDNHPNSLLYIHTDPNQMGGYPLQSHVQYLGLEQCVGFPMSQPPFPPTYKWKLDTPKSEMNLIMNTFDMLLAPSSTEGFMIPGIEAQACGVVPIVNRYTSMPELVIEDKTGFITEVSKDCKHFMPVGGYMKFPNIDSLYNKMEQGFRSNLQQMGYAARKWVVDNYDLEKVWSTKWIPFLDKLEKELYH